MIKLEEEKEELTEYWTRKDKSIEKEEKLKKEADGKVNFICKC